MLLPQPPLNVYDLTQADMDDALQYTLTVEQPVRELVHSPGLHLFPAVALLRSTLRPFAGFLWC